MAKIKIEFCTREFLFSHGRAPRGYGSWAFDFGAGPVFAPTGTYAEAKAWATRVLTTYTLAELAPLAGLGITPEVLSYIERCRQFSSYCRVEVCS